MAAATRPVPQAPVARAVGIRRHIPKTPGRAPILSSSPDCPYRAGLSDHILMITRVVGLPGPRPDFGQIRRKPAGADDEWAARTPARGNGGFAPHQPFHIGSRHGPAAATGQTMLRRASRASGTVYRRISTCGRPATPSTKPPPHRVGQLWARPDPPRYLHPQPRRYGSRWCGSKRSASCHTTGPCRDP
jgi:hypothetical protein